MLRISPIRPLVTPPRFARARVQYRVELLDPQAPWRKIYRVTKTTQGPNGPVTETQLFQRIETRWVQASEDLLTISFPSRHDLPQALEKRLNQAAAA